MRRALSPRFVSLMFARPLIVLGALVLAGPQGSAGAAEPDDVSTRLLRFPTLSRDAIAFAYAGDIWSVSRTGGVARQITSDPGIEMFPRYSPDGSMIAFTGQYDG